VAGRRMTRVVLVDDHHLVRVGLEQLLDAVGDVEVVGSASGGREAVALVSESRPDVVLMDLAMPGMDGIDATRRILELRPETRVVALTSFSDRDRILAVLDAGAVGYLLKDADPHDLVDGIRAAARGDAPLDPRAAGAVLVARRQRSLVEALTNREREVLRLVAAGLTNRVIALRLEIAEKTVKAHLTSIYQRIGVGDRAEAARWARRHGG
jgi:DNA-binding NarL/FixJ family response regulator